MNQLNEENYTNHINDILYDMDPKLIQGFATHCHFYVDGWAYDPYLYYLDGEIPTYPYQGIEDSDSSENKIPINSL